MGTAKMLSYLTGFLIVILVLFTFGGCAYRVFPKCDANSDDAFNEIVRLYEECMNYEDEDEDGCKCSDFDISELTENHKIILSLSEDDAMRISLYCNGRNAKNEYFEDEKIRIYFSDPKNFKTIGSLKKYELIGEQIKEEELSISEKILSGGFEIEGGFPLINNIGLLLGVDKTLTLVNYKGEVAFVAEEINQERKLREKPLELCKENNIK